MPRASLRSVLLICAFNAARICRVSTQIAGKPASASAPNSHCDSGPGFQANSLEVVDRVRQHPQQSVGFARYLNLTNDLARLVHNADAGLLDRHVQSSKML